MEIEAGRDVTLNDGQGFDLEAAEWEDQEPEKYKNKHRKQEGKEEDGGRMRR